MSRGPDGGHRDTSGPESMGEEGEGRSKRGEWKWPVGMGEEGLVSSILTWCWSNKEPYNEWLFKIGKTQTCAGAEE